MNKIDLIIDALEISDPTGQGWLPVYEQKHQTALAAARELRALKPVAWAATSEDAHVEALGFNQSNRFDTPLYALDDEVTK